MPRLILASASQARAAMLRNTGIAIDICPAHVDEDAIKRDLLGSGISPDKIAAVLAREKAISVCRDNSDAIVIGADQVLLHDGNLFDKPRSMKEAQQHLKTLRGDRHRLVSAVSVVQANVEIWSTSQRTDLTMRAFSDKFLDAYLAEFGEKALTSVGAYHLEGLGAQLFSKVEGDYFTVLGLPLLPLLEFLRTRGILTL